MIIVKVGIDASRAFSEQRTGIEEYSYQVIKHLCRELRNEEVFLYVRKNQKINLELPDNWTVKIINYTRLWTQVGLSLEILFHPVDVLFIPAHVVPIIHPKNTVVTVHGLEFEIFPEGYSFWARLYMRWSIKMSCQWAKTIIAVSNNTKHDLINLYGIDKDKIEVIYEGYDSNYQLPITNYQSISNDQLPIYKPYLLFIGRLEKRKNIEGILETYKILKEKYNIPHQLVLAGGPGYGYDIIKLKIKNYFKIKNSKLKIIELGYIDESSKWQLLSNADIFLFPTFYEGFGLPILEAQSLGVPVVCSDVSSLPEVAGKAAIFCDPKSPQSIAEAVYSLISNTELKNDIIEKGYENIKRFSWGDCGFKVSQLLKIKDGKI